MSTPWVKLWTVARNDPRLCALSDGAYRLWMNLLMLAGEGDDRRGCVDVSNRRLLAVELRLAPDVLDAYLAELTDLSLFVIADGEGTFPSWEKRQARFPSEYPEAVRERVRKHRAKAAVTTCNDPVTTSNEQDAVSGVTTPLPAVTTRNDHVTRCNDIEEEVEGEGEEERTARERDDSLTNSPPCMAHPLTMDGQRKPGRVWIAEAMAHRWGVPQGNHLPATDRARIWAEVVKHCGECTGSPERAALCVDELDRLIRTSAMSSPKAAAPHLAKFLDLDRRRQQ